ncbi:MAG: signal peptidase II [Candidatus Dojkabacteria bacterium]
MRVGRYILVISLLISFINFCLPYVLDIECIENRGVAFGLVIEKVWIFILIVLLLLLFLSFITRGILRYLFFSIVVLGMTNLVERLINGYICDYITFFNLSINLVDISLTILVIFTILILLKGGYGDTDRERK